MPKSILIAQLTGFISEETLAEFAASEHDTIEDFLGEEDDTYISHECEF